MTKDMERSRVPSNNMHINVESFDQDTSKTINPWAQVQGRERKGRSCMFYLFQAGLVIPFFCLWGFVVMACWNAFSTFFWMSFGTFLMIYCCTVTIGITVFGYRAVSKMQDHVDVDWLGKLEYEHPGEWNDIRHFVIIPNYKEDIDIMVGVLDQLAKCEMARENVFVVLAMEEREAGAQQKAKYFQDKYSRKFCGIFATYHPKDRIGELVGKSSNTSWAFREMMQFINNFFTSMGGAISKDDAMVHVMDADSLLHKRYFSACTYAFYEKPLEDRHNTFWQCPVINYQNYYSLPLLIRLSAITVTLHEIACMGNPSEFLFPMFRRLPFSTYAISLRQAEALGGWDVDVVAEDHHMFLKSYFFGSKRAKVDPIFLPMICTSVTDHTSVIKAIKSRRQQAIRHSIGAQEIAYMLCGIVETRSYNWDALMLSYKMFHMHIISTILGFCFVYLTSFTAMSLLTGHLEWALYFLETVRVVLNMTSTTLPFIVTMLLVNRKLCKFLLSRDYIEHPADGFQRFLGSRKLHWGTAYHLYQTLYPSLFFQVVMEYAGYFILSIFVAIYFFASTEYVAAWQLLNMQTFEYEVAAKPILSPMKHKTDLNKPRSGVSSTIISAQNNKDVTYNVQNHGPVHLNPQRPDKTTMKSKDMFSFTKPHRTISV